ncbi:hypothetical protein NDN08_004263 [Rhodosorus marinus]|uniref:Photosynthesis system II assembly factor Ycf48/Hcf136-like domain-containing protein n=1 Tax=Rhodosorus marinus TaxID=101924 RepID=A0AAV8UPC3_9RHOD|nr:hypothetical protein NDN08_004263 [Rhodosorus marinus]
MGYVNSVIGVGRGLRSGRLLVCSVGDCGIDRRVFLGLSGSVGGGLLCGGVGPVFGKGRLKGGSWEGIDFPSDAEIADVSTVSERAFFAVSKNGELLESVDGGSRWTRRTYFERPLKNIQFKGVEGWIVAKNGYLFYSDNAGRTWSPVSGPPRMVGVIFLATPVGRASVELVTSTGEVFKSVNGGTTWTQKVQPAPSILDGEFIGHLKSIRRDASGNYVALSSLGGNLFTLGNGANGWQSTSLPSVRNPMSVGFSSSSGGMVWLSDKTGDLYLANSSQLNSGLSFGMVRTLETNGYPVVDVAAMGESSTLIAVAGSGALYTSRDSGSTWTQDHKLNLSGGEVRRIRYPFAMGSHGILLRYRV